MITYQSIPSYWASSQAQAYFRLEIIFSNSINNRSKDHTSTADISYV